MIHIVKGFGIVNIAEVDVFLELSSFFDDPVDVGNLISGSSDFSKSSLNIWKFTVQVLLNLACRILASSEMSTRLVKAMVFPVVMYGCERWTIKKAEC